MDNQKCRGKRQFAHNYNNKTIILKNKISLKNRLINIYQNIRLSEKFIFSQRFLFFFAGVLVYFIIFCVTNYFQSSAERISEESIFIWLLTVPGIALVFYPSMSLITSETENRTIEMIFSTAGSRYKVWLTRIGVLYLFVVFIIFILCSLSFIFISDFPFFGYFFHSLFPPIFISSLIIMFSVIFRSSNAAGLLSFIVIFFLLIAYSPLSTTSFNLFLNPYFKPQNVDYGLWTSIVIYNRIGILLVSGFMLYYTLFRLNKREKYIWFLHFKYRIPQN